MSVPKAKTATLVETLTEGYWLINRHPWLIILPVLVNIYLVLGAQLSFAPLIEQLTEIMRRLAPPDTPTETALEPVAMLAQMDMRVPLALLNAVPTLPLRLLGDIGPGVTGLPQPATFMISSMWGIIAAFGLINLLALPLSALFLTRIAADLRSERPGLAGWLRQAGRATIMMLLTALIMAALAMALMFPILVLSTVLMAFSQPLGMLVMTLMFFIIFWGQIYLGFTNEALVLGRLNPLQALLSSFRLVRYNFWSTIGLLAMSYIILGGSAVIWRNLLSSPWGIAIAILGCAYIGTGIQAARFAFIRDRLGVVSSQQSVVSSQ